MQDETLIPSPVVITGVQQEQENKLFPVFLKLEQLRVLVVGGGYVAMEKLQAIFQNAPATAVTLVAPEITDDIKALAEEKNNLHLIQRPYQSSDLDHADIVIAAVNKKEVSAFIRDDAKAKGILINVADTPSLCDFYLSSIVKKGHLKIAISTNGKSPTIAKRLKEQIAEMIPDEMDSVLNNMQLIRNRMNGDFSEKVKKLNSLTTLLVAKQLTLDEIDKPKEKKWQRIVKWCLFAFFFMIVGHAVLSFVSIDAIVHGLKTIPTYIDTKTFLLMLLTGFIAQMTDGSMGMGYGTISTTFLLAMGVNPAIVSSRVHSARVFSSGVSGYSHHRFGNINRKLFKSLVIPGVLGAILGASLAFFGSGYAEYIRLPLSVYTLYLGFYIMRKAFAKRKQFEKVKKAGWLASVGGFLDAFAGGGWGTLVTSTLISKRRNPRYVIGSVCLAEFFVVLASSITFFIFLKSIPIADVLGLIIGGLIAAPIAARLVGKLPLKTMYIAIGLLVILTSFNTFGKTIIHLLK